MLVPATTALYRLAPPSFLAGYTFHFKRSSARRGGAQGAAHARRLHPREPGRLARRIRGARRADRPVPDGLGGALPRRPVRRRDRLDPHLRSRHASAASIRCPRCACCPAASSRWTSDARNAFRAPLARALEGDPTKVRLYKDIGAGIATAGIEYYLPLFFDETATVFDYLGERRDARAARRDRRGAAALLGRHARAPPLPAARPRAADPAARSAVPEARGVLHARATRTRSWRCAAARRRRALGDRPLPDLERRPRRARAADAPAGPRRGDAAPRADRRRERRPAREPAGAAARQPHRAAERRDARRVRGGRRAASRSPSRRSRRASSGSSRSDSATIEFITETELFATAPTARRRRSRSR